MKQFIVAMRRHGLPMIAAAASASVLTWMMCDLEYMNRRRAVTTATSSPSASPPSHPQTPQQTSQNPPSSTSTSCHEEWHGN